MLNKLNLFILMTICSGAFAAYSPQRPLSSVTDSVSVPLPSGAATSAAQATGNSSLSAIDTKLGNPLPLPSGAATSALQSTINTTLGSPFQVGGSIGNSSFGISGTLPAFTSTPTFNLGTLNGAATSAKQDSLLTALGSPFQAGGSIGNSSFGISGTLPAFASTPTFNLGTLNGAATASNQTSGAQKSQLVDSVTGIPANVSITGQLQTSIDPTEVFIDAFEGAVVDTTNRWNAAVIAGSGTVTQAASALTLTVGTTASNGAAISSQGTFATAGGSVRTFAVGATLEATTIATGNYRFWGLGTPGTSYSTTNPIANGVGFEVTTGGVLRAVMYSSDVLLSSTNLTVPTDGLQHIYFFEARGNFISFFMDASTIPVANIGLMNADVSTLPIRFASLNAGSTTTGTPALKIQGAAIIDNGRNSAAISDGTYGWRKATVDALGNLATTSPDLVITGQSAQTATVNNILTATSGATATDVSGYKSASVQVVSTGSGGTFIFEGSNDNSSWITIPVFNQLILTGTPIAAAVTATSSQIIYSFPVTTRYVRLRIATTITGGSVQAFSRFSQAPYSPAIYNVANATGANLSVAIASGTVTTVSTLSVLGGGQTANSSASTGSPVRTGGRVITTLDTSLAQGDATDTAMTTGQQLVVKQFGSRENDWTATSGVTALATTTSTQLKAAGAASIRNYVTACQFYNNSATVATTVSLLDGSTVIWTGYLPLTSANLQIVPVTVEFPTPLSGSAATAMNVQLGTTSSSVYYNCQGYQGF